MDTTTTTISLSRETTKGPTTQLPPITIGNSPEYVDKLVEISSRAFAAEPLSVAFASERLGISKVLPEHIASGHQFRADRKVKQGGSIIEAGDWAAAAFWEPPEMAVAAASFDAQVLDAQDPEIKEMLETRPIFAEFLGQIVRARRKHLGEEAKYWHLSMMARDPDKNMKGAVRAVIEPYLVRAKQDGCPIWIEAGSARARDVYAYFGCRIVGEIWSGRDKLGPDGYPMSGGPGVPTWFMTYDAKQWS